MYLRCTYVVVSREITIHKVIYGADIRFWPTLLIVHWVVRYDKALDARSTH